MGMMKEFRDFAVRGNVMDLAVGVIIGAAFGKIVDSLVKDLITPLIGWLIGKPDFTNWFCVLKLPDNYTGPHTYEALTKAGATLVGYGAFLTVLLNFVLLAFAVFGLIKLLNSMKGRAEAEAAVVAPTEDVLLLREIRDALKK